MRSARERRLPRRWQSRQNLARRFPAVAVALLLATAPRLASSRPRCSTSAAMGVLALSDLLLSGTLLVNAGAVLSFKLGAPTSLDSGATTKDRFVALLASLRLFRVVIGIWNVFLVFLMIVWFP